MNIDPQIITVRELTQDYRNDGDGGVFGYGGRLDIRPPYQREMVYSGKNVKKKYAVIDTVLKKFPLNVMYWVKNENGYEVLDGQQRTISICEFVTGDFSIVDEQGNTQYFETLDKEDQEKILNYELTVYFCEGTDKEKLSWFRTINIAGEKLTDQELLNATYTGSWLAHAKKKFSDNKGPANLMGGHLMKGTPIRQDYLETVLKWINEGKPSSYMAFHRDDEDANELWNYYQDVVNWVNKIFIVKRPEMNGLAWGEFYNDYKDKVLNPDKVEERIVELFADDEVQVVKGVYRYILDGNEKHLKLRTFTNSQKTKAHAIQKGVCPICTETFTVKEMEGDHRTPWSRGGKTELDNCDMLCKQCHLDKTRRQVQQTQ